MPRGLLAFLQAMPVGGRGRRRKGSTGDGSDERCPKRGRGQKEGPSRSKRRAAGGDDGLEDQEAKRRRKNQDETTKRKKYSGGGGGGGSVSDGDDDDDDYDDEEEAVFLPDVPRPIKWGRRSRQDGKPWTCAKCGTVNQPSRHLFVDLPAFECTKCKEPGHACFKFSFGNLSCNGVCPVGKIQDQKNTDYCISHAFAMQAEMTMRIMSVLSDNSRDPEKKFPVLCPYSLQTHDIMAMEFDEGPDFFSTRAMERMAEVVAQIGIDDTTYQVRYKAGKVERVDPDFPTICRALADGYPLTTDIVPGWGFSDLEYGKIYKSRYSVEDLPKGCRVDAHVLVLVGASRSEVHDSYYFANTYGDKYCLRINKVTGTKSGGIGKIRAKDISCKPFKFIRLAKVE